MANKFLDLIKGKLLLGKFLGNIEFPDDVNVGGDLTVTGSTNTGVDEVVIGNFYIDGAIYLDNSQWIYGETSAGGSYVGMFSVNSSDEIDVGAVLNVNGYEFAEDSGMVTFVNMPINSASLGDVEGYVFSIASKPVFKVLSEADGAGSVDKLQSQFFGGIIRNTTVVNAATYDLLAGDDVLLVTYTSIGAVTSLTLPTAQVVNGRTIVVKDAGGNAGTNNITVDTEGSETIDGAATLVINTNYDSVTLVSDGSNWFTI